MIGLTQRQADCLRAIAELTREGVSPTYDEVGARIGITGKSSIARLIAALEERGALRRIPHRSRALEVVWPVNGQHIDLEAMSVAELTALSDRVDTILRRRATGAAA